MNYYKNEILEKVAKSIDDMNKADATNHINNDVNSTKKNNKINMLKSTGKGLLLGTALGIAGGKRQGSNTIKIVNKAGTTINGELANKIITSRALRGAALGAGLGSAAASYGSRTFGKARLANRETESTRSYMQDHGITDRQINEYLDSRSKSPHSRFDLSVRDVEAIKKKIKNGGLSYE